MNEMKRAAAIRACACGQENVLLMPIAACGMETIWDVRCAGCGAHAWFDALADADFRRALAEAKHTVAEVVAQREETDRRFATLLPPCACGGRRHLVRELEKEPCAACGKPLAAGALREAAPVDEPSLR